MLVGGESKVGSTEDEGISGDPVEGGFLVYYAGLESTKFIVVRTCCHKRSVSETFNPGKSLILPRSTAQHRGRSVFVHVVFDPVPQDIRFKLAGNVPVALGQAPVCNRFPFLIAF